MQRGWKTLVAVAVIAAVLGGGAGYAAAQINIGSLIKLFGIGYVVKAFGPQINDAINTLMLNNKAENREVTKVVPILSVVVGVSTSGGSYIGAAQVQGPKAAVDKVQAVAQIEGVFSNVLRLRGLIPVDSLNPIPGNLHRVYGVGVSALVDFSL
jgi:hypothetical protein